MRVSPITNSNPIKQPNHVLKNHPSFNGKWGFSLGAAGGAAYGTMVVIGLGSVMAVAAAPIVAGATAVGAIAGHILQNEVESGSKKDKDKDK